MDTAIELTNVSKSFGAVPVVRDWSMRIMRGDRIGLIGPNGSGKTTLLRLLVGELEPDAGVVRRGARLDVALGSWPCAVARTATTPAGSAPPT